MRIPILPVVEGIRYSEARFLLREPLPGAHLWIYGHGNENRSIKNRNPAVKVETSIYVAKPRMVRWWVRTPGLGPGGGRLHSQNQ